jgi:predicted nucleic acid-binding protein
MKRLRVYADTSVYGGCFDEEFARESLAFFEAVRKGKFRLIVSPTVLAELQRAPLQVRRVLAELSEQAVEMVEIADEVERLRDAYLEAKVLSLEHLADAEHIASASVAEVDFVVSWNFKHIVQFEKITGYQAVNLLNGYREIRIYSPREVVANEDE